MNIMVAWAARKKRGLVLCLWGAFMMLGAVIAAPSASAVPLTFSYDGTVTSQSFPNPDLNGQIMAVEYTFDSAIIDIDPQPDTGVYENVLTSLTVTIGSNTWIFSNGGAGFGTITVGVSGGFLESYQLTTNFPTPPTVTGPGFISIFQLSFITSTIPVTDDSLPISPPDPTLFTGFTAIGLGTSGGSTVTAEDTVTLSSNAVSAPAGAPLALAGLAALGFVQRRRKRGAA